MNFKTYIIKNINFIEHDLEVFASGRTTDGIKYLRLLLSDMKYDLADLEKNEKEKDEIMERLRNNTTNVGGEISVSHFNWEK